METKVIINQTSFKLCLKAVDGLLSNTSLYRAPLLHNLYRKCTLTTRALPQRKNTGLSNVFDSCLHWH